ncbi:MAG: hypothetical protein HUJ25_02985 [Crocinitomicaceae bacterium]|nr:hypothetical protein [Crocinitomicaceae bacterium]
MKSAVLILIFSLLGGFAHSQTENMVFDTSQTYRVVLTDGNELIGKILKSDEREIYMSLEDGRKIYVPQYQIKSTIKVDKNEYNAMGKFVGEDRFATRYFITTNGLPMKKGEHYVQWNIFGPDFQFAPAENFGVGLMTTWIGSPVLLTTKYSFQLGEKAQFAVGAVGGSGTWLAPDWGGVLPFATLSYGSRRANIAVSGGYGAVWPGGDAQGRALGSIAGMVKVGPKVSLVFDSFILFPSTETRTYYDYDYQTGQSVPVTQTYKSNMLALVVPGVRWHIDSRRAFQFGMTGVVVDNDVLPVPIPMVQWYRSF